MIREKKIGKIEIKAGSGFICSKKIKAKFIGPDKDYFRVAFILLNRGFQINWIN